jgi:hypothetical protein
VESETDPTGGVTGHTRSVNAKRSPDLLDRGLSLLSEEIGGFVMAGAATEEHQRHQTDLADTQTFHGSIFLWFARK